MIFPLSICIIARNAEKTLHKCLQSIYGVAGEVIFLDTGSEDNTPFIARKAGAKVYSFVWNNDFSAARNEALKHVAYPWNLFLDTDEELIVKDPLKFKSLLNAPLTDSYYLVREEILSENDRSETLRCRLLKTEKNYRYQGRIHETPLINPDTSETISKDIIYLKHYGYNVNFSNPEEKNSRNLKILRDSEETNNINNLVYLLKELELKHTKEKTDLISKIDRLIKTYSAAEIKSNIVLVSFFQEAIIVYSFFDKTDITEKYCLEALSYFSDELTLLSMAGELYFRKKDYEKSLAYYLKITELVSRDAYLKGPTVHQGVKTYGTYYNIALCYKMKGEKKTSSEYAEKALKIKPDFGPAKELIGNIGK